MKKYSILVISVLAFSSSLFAQNNSAISEQRDLRNFAAISLNIPAEVTLKQGDYAFSVSASADVLEKLKTEVKNNELVIKFENSSHMETKEPIRIEITLPSITALEVNGSGEFISSGSFNSDNLNLEINGSGKISLSSLTTKKLAAEINGSGRIADLNGTANEVKMQVNGSGEISTINFLGKNVECAVTGSGHISVGAGESLDAKVTGSGDIHYAGSPNKKDVSVIGTGTISAMN